MHVRSLACTVLVALSLCTLAAQTNSEPKPSDEWVGTWAGTWDGAGSGEFELTLDKTQDGGPVGRVAVTTDGGNYTADLKAIAIDGDKMNAKYDFPLDTGSEVIVLATFAARSAKGTWSLRPRGQETELAAGTWTVTKK
jgi:hypothetical protein